MARFAVTKRRRELWLEEFAKHGNKAAASRSTGVSAKSINDLASSNRFFFERMEEARLIAVGRLEEEAYRRAIDGTPNYVVSDGRVVRYRGKPLVKREYSDSLLSLLLRAHGGDSYKTKTDNLHRIEEDGDEAARKLADALSRKFGVDKDAGPKSRKR